jgi:multidrug efflux system outer membrane protein
MMLHRLAVPIIALVFLSGCAVGPDYERPELSAPVPQQWSAPLMTKVLPHETAGGGQRWWEEFGDPVLNTLVADALAHNNDLVAAAGRVLEARAALGGSESARWPSIEIGGTAARSQRTAAQTTPGGDRIGESYSASADLRWEADLWGRLSRGKEAALASLRASELERRAVAQGVIVGVVSTWLQIRELEMQLDLNRRTVESYTGTLQTVESRYIRGLVSSLDLYLARQNLAAARALTPTLEQSLAAASRGLEILVGEYPAGALPERGADAEIAMPPLLKPVPAGLPADLLERRPDLRAAEERLHASVAQVGQAKAALYPGSP